MHIIQVIKKDPIAMMLIISSALFVITFFPPAPGFYRTIKIQAGDTLFGLLYNYFEDGFITRSAVKHISTQLNANYLMKNTTKNSANGDIIRLHGNTIDIIHPNETMNSASILPPKLYFNRIIQLAYHYLFFTCGIGLFIYLWMIHKKNPIPAKKTIDKQILFEALRQGATMSVFIIMIFLEFLLVFFIELVMMNYFGSSIVWLSIFSISYTVFIYCLLRIIRKKIKIAEQKHYGFAYKFIFALTATPGLLFVIGLLRPMINFGLVFIFE